MQIIFLYYHCLKILQESPSLFIDIFFQIFLPSAALKMCLLSSQFLALLSRQFHCYCLFFFFFT